MENKTINFDNYMNECSAVADMAYSTLSTVERFKLNREKDFKFRYICYLEWGMPLTDWFNKDYRVANFFANVFEASCEYTDVYADGGWDTDDVIVYMKAVKRAARKIGYKGKFRIKEYSGKRVRIYLNDVAYVCRDAIQVVETMYDIADYLASKQVDNSFADFVGSFMHREYTYMNAVSTS